MKVLVKLMMVFRVCPVFFVPLQLGNHYVVLFQIASLVMTVISTIRVLKQGVLGHHCPFHHAIQGLIIRSFGRCNWQGLCRARLCVCVCVNQRRQSGSVPGSEILSTAPWPHVVMKNLCRMCVFRVHLFTWMCGTRLDDKCGLELWVLKSLQFGFIVLWKWNSWVDQAEGSAFVLHTLMHVFVMAAFMWWAFTHV